jgi:hypothetical protein
MERLEQAHDDLQRDPGEPALRARVESARVAVIDAEEAVRAALAERGTA